MKLDKEDLLAISDLLDENMSSALRPIKDERESIRFGRRP